jgi:hypothetical protein
MNQNYHTAAVPQFAEVEYFFQATINGQIETLALISCYDAPDTQLAEASSGALLACRYQGDNALKVIPVKLIASCIAMVPFKDKNNMFFICEKMGLEVAFLGGAGDHVAEDAE